VLCDPTAGVDISSRFAIYELIAKHVREGLSVIVTSSDMGDLVALCSRVLIFQDGKSIGELPRAALSESQLVHAIEGLMTVDDPGTKRAGQSD
jgi:ABC-type sugar transport system ATPase subunit